MSHVNRCTTTRHQWHQRHHQLYPTDINIWFILLSRVGSSNSEQWNITSSQLVTNHSIVLRNIGSEKITRIRRIPESVSGTNLSKNRNIIGSIKYIVTKARCHFTSSSFKTIYIQHNRHAPFQLHVFTLSKTQSSNYYILQNVTTSINMIKIKLHHVHVHCIK